MEARLDSLFKKPEEYKVLDKFPGEKLKGEEYEPLFDYFIEYREKGGFRVSASNLQIVEFRPLILSPLVP
jgi:isoleucyl-tRNA synthetase